MSRKAVEALGPRNFIDSLKTVVVLWINQIADNLPNKYHPYAEWAVNCSNDLDFWADTEEGIWQPFLLRDIPYEVNSYLINTAVGL